jgi:arabinofuranosyltransferase
MPSGNLTTRVLRTDPRRTARILAVMAPIIVILIMGWQHRWLADDGFINFRYVDQIRHGNGPVFNAGERVEAFTSPAWLALLLGFDLILPLRIEWIAVVSGLALVAAGFAFAAAGSARLWRRVVGEGTTFPAGLLVFAALPPAWDFATSGLDTALAVAWLGASWWVLCRRCDTRSRARSRRGRQTQLGFCDHRQRARRLRQVLASTTPGHHR